MGMEIVDLEMVEEINQLVEEWNIADRYLRSFFHGWQQRSARAGLERGFYLQVGNLVSENDLHEFGATPHMTTHEIGEMVYAAYRRGGVPTDLYA
jgi:hypothetical protein